MAIHININVPTDFDFTDDIWIDVNVGETPFTSIEEEIIITCDDPECEMFNGSCGKCSAEILDVEVELEEVEELTLDNEK